MMLNKEYKNKIEKQNQKKELEDDKSFLQYARQQFEKNKIYYEDNRSEKT